ncbi:MBL fold metallo-hydrolase [Haliangium sp.]|uniref:MBL fold metallo-hydrolase n=1 Tax=Haliangium sp. TaxID=2663208 RepID=UPI003D1041B8
MTTFEIQFHGVRGSMASPGVHTAQVGGNTSCVEVRAGEQRIVFDAGTGLRTVGERMMSERGLGTKTTILLSHVHWDHIQGLPFFTPIYVPGCEIDVVSGPNGFMPLEQVLRRQMSPPFFPVAFDDLASRLRATDVRPQDHFELGDAMVTVARLNHPDPVYGYRVEYGGRSIVYATDTEHYRCVDPTLRKLAAGADVLIYDAQYTPEEYSGQAGPAKVGWGHSTFEAAAELARAAEVGQLVLFHHDPSRSDQAVADIEARAQILFTDTVAAREGVTFAVGGEQPLTSYSVQRSLQRRARPRRATLELIGAGAPPATPATALDSKQASGVEVEATSARAEAASEAVGVEATSARAEAASEAVTASGVAVEATRQRAESETEERCASDGRANASEGRAEAA